MTTNAEQGGRLEGLLVRLEMRERPAIFLGAPWPETPSPGPAVAEYHLQCNVTKIEFEPGPALGVPGRYFVTGGGAKDSELAQKKVGAFTFFSESEVLRPHYVVPLQILNDFIEQEREDFAEQGLPLDPGDAGEGGEGGDEPEEAPEAFTLPPGVGGAGAGAGAAPSPGFVAAQAALRKP